MSSHAQDCLASVIADAVKSSVEVTFNSIFGEPPVPVASDGPTESCARVASVISFFGTTPWALMLVLPEDTAVKMALRFAGFEIPFDCADMGDVVGELTNVLAGEVVAQLNRRGIQSQMSLPIVARGNDVELLMPTGAPASHLEYQSAQGRCWFEICTASAVQRLCRQPERPQSVTGESGGAVIKGGASDETLWGKGFWEGRPVAPRQVARSTGNRARSNRLKRARTPLVPSRCLSRSDWATTNERDCTRESVAEEAPIAAR